MYDFMYMQNSTIRSSFFDYEECSLKYALSGFLVDFDISAFHVILNVSFPQVEVKIG